MTTNDVGFSSVNDIINGAGTRNYEYDEEIKTVMQPSQFARSQAVPVRLKTSVLLNADDAQYAPNGTIRTAFVFSKPRGVVNPGSPTILGDVYISWHIRLSGRIVVNS